MKSHRDYLIEAWGSAAKTNLSHLQTTQNKIIKLLFHLNYLTPTVTVYKKTKLMTLAQLYNFKTCMLVRKILNRDIHTQITFTKKNHVNKRLLRCANYIYLKKSRTNYGKRTIKYDSAQLYNKLPTDIKDIQSLLLFKKTLKHHILTKF